MIQFMGETKSWALQEFNRLSLIGVIMCFNYTVHTE